MMMGLSEILRRPLITERTTQLREQNKFVFEVNPNATKGQIREAIETAFKVDVLDINTMNVPGKLRRRGRTAGYQSNWKKAIVKLKAGQEIKYAEPAK